MPTTTTTKGCDALEALEARIAAAEAALKALAEENDRLALQLETIERWTSLLIRRLRRPEGEEGLR